MMTKTRYFQAFVAFSLVAVVLVAQRARSVEPANAMAPLPIAAADLKWTDLDPVGAPGVKIAVLWGNQQNGPFGAFLKLPAGFKAPLHTHTHDMKLVIVSGTYIQGPDGQQEFRLGPGSYLLQPGGNYRHTTSCDQASDCLFFFESDGAFDLLPVATGQNP
jgi:anti-sigma factor ChrR (cupin superfamily)